MYSIDTSALLEGWVRRYPPTNFPNFWERMDELIQNGKLRASVEVFNDLEKKSDEIFVWAKERKQDLFLEIDDPTQEALSNILSTYPRLVDSKKGRSASDPIVIAVAMVNKGWLVVTEEKPSGKIDVPKIPDVCDAENISSINLLELIQKEKWVF